MKRPAFQTDPSGPKAVVSVELHHDTVTVSMFVYLLGLNYLYEAEQKS